MTLWLSTSGSDCGNNLRRNVTGPSAASRETHMESSALKRGGRNFGQLRIVVHHAVCGSR